MKPEPYALRRCRPGISQLARIVRELCAAAGRWCLPLVAAATVVAIQGPAPDLTSSVSGLPWLPRLHASSQIAMPAVVSGSDAGDRLAAVTAVG